MPNAIVRHSELCSIRPRTVRFTSDGDLQCVGCKEIICSSGEYYRLSDAEKLQIWEIFKYANLR
jgi:hypothetical protein